MLAVNFEDVVSTEGIALQSLIPGTLEGLTGAQGMASADQIQVWENGAYTYYYLYKTTLTIPTLAAKNGKWVTQSGAIADVKFKNGDVFWFKKQGDTDVDVIIAGSVSLVAEQNVAIINGYNMIGNKIPLNFNPNSLGVDFWKNSGAVGAQGMASADQIQVWDVTKEAYTYYYLYYTTLTVPTLSAKNWKWVTQAGTVIGEETEVIPVGKGAWYKHQGTGFTLKLDNLILK